MSETVHCALIGAGTWGRLLAEALVGLDGVVLAGVADVDLAAARGVAGQFGARTYASTDEALADPAVTAVVVAVPNDRHAAVAQAALRQGKHLFLEKPMALLASDADAIVTGARKRHCVLMVNHLQRHYAPLREVKRLADAGSLGRVLAVSVRRRDLLHRTIPWLQQRRHVGGLLYQSACHEFDFVCWLCGEPKEISCQAAPHIIASDTLDYPDLILSQLRFASGAIAQVWNCMSDPLMGYDGVVAGSEGTATFDLYRGWLRWQRHGSESQVRTWDPSDGWAPWAWVNGGGIAVGEADALRGMLTSFRDAVRGVSTSSVTGEDGARTVELAQAGYLSLAEGRPVALPLAGADRCRAAYNVPAGSETPDAEVGGKPR